MVSLSEKEILEILNGDVSDDDELREYSDDEEFENYVVEGVQERIEYVAGVGGDTSIDLPSELLPESSNLDNLSSTANVSNDIEDVPLSQRLGMVQSKRKKAAIVKWECSDIDLSKCDTACNVHFSEPPEEMTPMKYFKLFISDEMTRYIAEETNVYATQKSGNSVNTNSSEIEQFFGIHIMSGVIKVPSYRFYWTQHSRIEKIADVMSRNRFDKLRSYIHFVNNDNLLPRDDPNHDRLFKIRPFVTALKENLKKMEIEENLCVDEIIIPFKGRSSLKQYVKNKPHKWGIKVFAITSSSGILHDFEIYIGKGTVTDINLGISGDIVLRLAEIVPNHKNYKLAFDNWFSSHPLLVALKERGIWTCCTVRANRTASCVLASDKTLKTSGRGSSDVRTDKQNNIACVKWFDNKSVHLMSSYAGVEPTDVVRRWSVKDKIYINVNRPAIVKEYNKFMGGVDLLDMLVALYRINLRAKRYYLRIIFHLIDICVVNGWLLYKRHCQQRKEKHMPLVHFRLEIANALLQSGKVVKRKRGRPSNEVDNSVEPPRKRSVCPAPVNDVRFDQIGHWPVHNSNKQRCKLCVTAKSRIRCSKCDVALCLHDKKNCFFQYHQK